ncbi:MAG: MarR family transcriptional regulator [Burkholderiales bacterium]|nr:MarR family transcriptional regulator [Burkholderiales bacterium]MDE2455023.1 MarR family transcriptional regulator [Burkholderiales bacterium]
MRKPQEPSHALTPQGQLAESGLNEVIGYHLAQARIATTRNFDEQVRTPFGLRPVEFTLVALLRDNPGATPARIAKALDVTAASVTMIVDRLSEGGLIRREASTADRRSQNLYLTAKGERQAAEALRRVVAGEAERLDFLSFGERALLIELLRKIARAR